MAKNAAAIVVGAAGSLYTAPLASTEPAFISTALDAAFLELGYVGEDGAQMVATMTIEEIRAWQSAYPVRRIATEREFTLSATLLEWNVVTVPFFFGGGTITEPDDIGNPGEYLFTPPDPSAIDERMLALEWADGTKDYRIVVSRGMVTETDNTQLQRTDAAGLPITFGTMSNEAAGNPWFLQTDDPAFAAA